MVSLTSIARAFGVTRPDLRKLLDSSDRSFLGILVPEEGAYSIQVGSGVWRFRLLDSRGMQSDISVSPRRVGMETGDGKFPSPHLIMRVNAAIPDSVSMDFLQEKYPDISAHEATIALYENTIRPPRFVEFLRDYNEFLDFASRDGTL